MQELKKTTQIKISELMKSERILNGRSIRTLARKFKVKRKILKKWEGDVGSPPVNILEKIFRSYGKHSLEKLASLNVEIHIEKYEKIKSRDRSEIISTR